MGKQDLDRTPAGGRVSPDQAQEKTRSHRWQVAPTWCHPGTQAPYQQGHMSCDALRDFSHQELPWPPRDMPDRLMGEVGMCPVGMNH